jgi:hypothetical protein
MARFIQGSLRLNGINVAAGVVSGLLRNGSDQAPGQTPTNLSFTRHFTAYPGTDADLPVRYERPTMVGAGRTARRAGRSGYCAGVLGSRIFAASAKPAIEIRWPSLERSAARQAWRHVRSMAQAAVVSRVSGHSLIPPTRALPGQQPGQQGGIQGGNWSAPMPAVGMAGCATRGK